MNALQKTGEKLTQCLLNHYGNDKLFYDKLNNAFIKFYRKQGSLSWMYRNMYESSKEGKRQMQAYNNEIMAHKYRFANSPLILAAARGIATNCRDAAKAYIGKKLASLKDDLEEIKKEYKQLGVQTLDRKQKKRLMRHMKAVKASISLYSKDISKPMNVPIKESSVFIAFVEELREDLRRKFAV
jgi:hypothetical protein